MSHWWNIVPRWSIGSQNRIFGNAPPVLWISQRMFERMVRPGDYFVLVRLVHSRMQISSSRPLKRLSVRPHRDTPSGQSETSQSQTADDDMSLFICLVLRMPCPIHLYPHGTNDSHIVSTGLSKSLFPNTWTSGGICINCGSDEDYAFNIVRDGEHSGFLLACLISVLPLSSSWMDMEAAFLSMNILSLSMYIQLSGERVPSCCRHNSSSIERQESSTPPFYGLLLTVSFQIFFFYFS